MKKSMLMLSSVLFFSICSGGFVAAEGREKDAAVVRLPEASEFKTAGVSEDVIKRLNKEKSSISRVAKKFYLEVSKVSSDEKASNELTEKYSLVIHKAMGKKSSLENAKAFAKCIAQNAKGNDDASTSGKTGKDFYSKYSSIFKKSADGHSDASGKLDLASISDADVQSYCTQRKNDCIKDIDSLVGEISELKNLVFNTSNKFFHGILQYDVWAKENQRAAYERDAKYFADYANFISRLLNKPLAPAPVGPGVGGVPVPQQQWQQPLPQWQQPLPQGQPFGLRPVGPGVGGVGAPAPQPQGQPFGHQPAGPVGPGVGGVRAPVLQPQGQPFGHQQAGPAPVIRRRGTPQGRPSGHRPKSAAPVPVVIRRGASEPQPQDQQPRPRWQPVQTGAGVGGTPPSYVEQFYPAGQPYPYAGQSVQTAVEAPVPPQPQDQVLLPQLQQLQTGAEGGAPALQPQDQVRSEERRVGKA
ncbi:MAG: hypothetical protein LBB29_00360, partial [Holosporaceae bacterium]|nr:hypothetical protein [Holosporaceae bacterium]